jgi:hypothetical protein
MYDFPVLHGVAGQVAKSEYIEYGDARALMKSPLLAWAEQNLRPRQRWG